MRKYRFFYHYNKQARMMTVHWRGVCWLVTHLAIDVPTETKYNAKRQPHVVVQGFAKHFHFNPTTLEARISNDG